MAEANASAAWDHTASVLCMLFNANRGPKSKPARFEDFHPYRKRKREAMTVDQLRALKPLIEAMGK